MPTDRKSHAQTACPPPHTVLHGWRTPERQRNGDLVVPLVNAAGEMHGLRATAPAWREFAHALLAALGTQPARSLRARAAQGLPLTKPGHRTL